METEINPNIQPSNYGNQLVMGNINVVTGLRQH